MRSIALLTKEPKTYDSRSLKRAIESHGFKPVVIDYTNPEIMGELADAKVDAVIVRHTPEYASRVADIVASLESRGAKSTASSRAIRIANDKFETAAILKSSGVDTPTTIRVGEQGTTTVGAIEHSLGPRFILKPINGSQGIGVELVDLSSWSETAEYIRSKAGYIAQEYIEESNGEDIRAFVVGGKVVASMKRSAAVGEIRSNLHLGGKASRVDLSHDETEVAIKASQALGLGVAGVDIVRSKRGPLVIEVNSSPGLRGIERLTGLDISSIIVDHLAFEA